MQSKEYSRHSAIEGCLLGAAVGDALGLPYEGLSPRRAMRLLGRPDRHRFFFKRGMVSDDTEHLCLVLQSLVESGLRIEEFQRVFARKLKVWLLCLPAGTGMATARAIAKLLLGFPLTRSGVLSAGNGPVMRASILGVMLPLHQLRDFVTASTTITHTDPKATWGALAVALAAHMASGRRTVDPNSYLKELQALLSDRPAEEFMQLIEQSVRSVNEDVPTQTFSQSICSKSGVSGYVYETVPVAIHAWLQHQSDYSTAIQEVISCGGDADTTAAIVGGIVGTHVGPEGIPKEWQTELCDWPLSTFWMKKLSDSACGAWQGEISKPLNLPVWGRILRNLIFLVVVLAHGFRRLFPPY